MQSLHAQRLIQLFIYFCMFKALKPQEMDNPCFFQMSLFPTKCAPFLLKIEEDFDIDD
jgi:hypothetical protein